MFTQLPADIADIVQGVFGLDDRPQAKAHFQRRARTGIRAMTPDTSFTPTQLADLYFFPPDADGSGQCIALIELGGGYQSRDLNAIAPRRIESRSAAGRGLQDRAVHRPVFWCLGSLP